MRFIEKTAVGIDISEQHISLAMIRQGDKGIELVKSACVDIPKGAVNNGNIEDSLLFAKAVNELKHKCKIRRADIALSAFARPVVVQIIDMPKQMPQNIRQYVQTEIRNCVVLPSRDIVLDFCPVGTGKKTVQSNTPHAEKKVLAVGAEEAKMLELVKICGKAGFHVEKIEPALFAYMRALYSQNAAGKNHLNVLMALMRGTSLSLCVFKNGSIDFIRTKEFIGSAEEKHNEVCPVFGKGWNEIAEECQCCAKTFSDEYKRCRTMSVNGGIESKGFGIWLSRELTEVIRFYDIEVPDNAGKWDVHLYLENHQSSKEIENNLKAAVPAGHLQIRTIEDACIDTPAGKSDKNEKPSLVAIGLAMRLLAAQTGDVKINLVPNKVIKIREVKRDALLTANVIAVVLFVMILTIAGFAFMIEKVNNAAVFKKQVVSQQDTEKMLEQQHQFDGRLNILSARVDKMAQISLAHNDVNWVEILEDIKNATPGSVLITSITCPDGVRINVEGLATSNDAVNLFVGLLEKTHCIGSVTLLEARKQDGQKDLITYQLSCKLANRSAKT